MRVRIFEKYTSNLRKIYKQKYAYILEHRTIHPRREMIHYLWYIFRNFAMHLEQFINIRMEGMPYFSGKTAIPYDSKPTEYAESQEYVTNSFEDESTERSIDLVLPPCFFQKWVGKYGSEIVGKLNNTDTAIGILHNYIQSLGLPTNKTFHRFESELPGLEYNAIQFIKYSNIITNIYNSFPNHSIHSIVEMNELYVSCIGADGSDRVFETPHIDGLFAWLPSCNVFRCIVAIQGNRDIQTIFPLSENKYTLDTMDYVAFDYNRSVHYIYATSPPEGTMPDKRERIILKLHYLICPEWMPDCIIELYKSIHGNYNAFLRGLFLRSQITRTLENTNIQDERPTWMQQYISDAINHGTTIYVHLFLLGLFITKCITYMC